MIPHDILTLYSAKMLEYGIAALFLLLFIPFWRYVQGTAPEASTAKVRRHATIPSDWFHTPHDRLYHRGHAWMKVGDDGLVTVGLDTFAARLVGPLSQVALPAVGDSVGQGERGWRLTAPDGRSVAMLSPVDGTVVDVNAALAESPGLAGHDPYGDGWLFKVRPSRLRANQSNLMAGHTARRWVEEKAAWLRSAVDPALGALAQDGGEPVAGMAVAIAPEKWDHVAATALLTSEEDGHA